MGEAIGRDYVELYYPPESKAIMDQMVANIRTAMRRRIEGLTWMGPATKKEALDKLASFGLKIGHPDSWRDYSGLEVRPGDLFGNAERAQRFEWDLPPRPHRAARGQGRVGDDAADGQRLLPADEERDRLPGGHPAAALLRSAGRRRGELRRHRRRHRPRGHARLRRPGSQVGRPGLLRDWWTAEDARRFEAQAERLGRQYASYTFPALPDMRINPQVSMGENIADLGGVLIAHEAYRELMSGKLPPIIDGFTADQRLFMGWAQVWRIVWRDEALRQQLVNGPHSPGQIRAFAPLRNVDAWYSAFGIKPGDTLYLKPEERVRIW
jgi:putative endopeptidase